MTETATYKAQRNITKKIHNQELRFLCTARRQTLVNISMKFHEDILNGFKVIEQKQFCHRNCYLQSSTDSRMDGHGKNNMAPNPEVGRHNNPSVRSDDVIFSQIYLSNCKQRLKGGLT